MALRINPRLLTQQFEYHEFEKTNAWAKPSYKEPILIKKVRIDQTPETAPMSSATNGVALGTSKVICKAIAYAYASDTTPFPEFKKRSKIVTKNAIYTINKVVKVNEPFEDKLWSVELELV